MIKTYKLCYIQKKKQKQTDSVLLTNTKVTADVWPTPFDSTTILSSGSGSPTPGKYPNFQGKYPRSLRYRGDQQLGDV